jgi:hypothetical protein
LIASIATEVGLGGRIVNEAAEQDLTRITSADAVERAMIEGYIATREDRGELNRDWQIVDGEDWPD